MKKREEIIVDALSQIDDEIIERNTEKRLRLIAHPRIKRSIIYSVTAMVACFAVILSVVIGLLGGGTPSPVITPGQIPVYQGMTVSDTYSPMLTASRTHNKLLAPKPPHKDDIKTDEEVNNSVLAAESKEELYYATVGQDVYITVHINNPDQYEILSFTLNGKTYSSYMFEEGSDMESLVLKVNVGNTTGIKEYTIDAIKYVDGTEIKDVRMDGDRTIAISIGDGSAPGATVQATVEYYRITLAVGISDTGKLVEYYGNNVFAALSDENGEVVKLIRINGTEGSVTFDSLEQGTTYAYSIFAVYKAETDAEPDIHVLAEGVVSTVSGINSLGAAWQADSSSFTVTLDPGNDAIINSVLILDGESTALTLDIATLLATGSLNIPVSDLLYNHTYSLVVSYTLDGERYTEAVPLTTPALTAPTVTITDIAVTENSMTVSVSVSDPDGVAKKLNLAVGGNQVYEYIYTATDRELTFTIPVSGLNDATIYRVTASVSYNLFDGAGTKWTSANATEKTHAMVTATNMLLRNMESVYVGGKFILQINLNNENRDIITHVVINGKTYAVASTSTATMLNVEVDTTDWSGGTHTLTLEALITGEREIPCENTLTVTAQLLVKFAFVGVSFVGEDYTEKVCYDYGETIYVIVTLEGGEGATVTSAVGRSSLNGYKDLTLQGFVKLDDNHYRIPLSVFGNYTGKNSVGVYLTGLTYVKDSQSVTLSVDCGVTTVSILPQISDNVVYIYDADDLKNVDDGYHYILANDIDLGGANWTPVVFRGTLDGNGFAIKNLTCVGDENSTTGFVRETTWSGGCRMTAGLFSTSDGTIYNLRFEGIYVNINHKFSKDGDSASFELFGSGTHIIFNCVIDSTSSITVTNTNIASDYSGYVVELFCGKRITHCASFANISMAINGYPDAWIKAFDADEITDCIMGGNIVLTGSEYYHSPSIYIPDLTFCYNECTFTSRNVRVYVGEALINSKNYSIYDCTVEFIGDGYYAYIDDGYNTVIEVFGEGIAKPNIPILQKQEKVFEINLTVTGDNLAYTDDGVTLYSRMGLELTDYNIPSDVTTVIIYLPSEFQGIKISHIEFVRITYEGETYCYSQLPYRVRVVIPDGIKKIGKTEGDYGDAYFQPFTDGIIHELVIPDTVETITSYSFIYFEERPLLDTIYCKADSKPTTWQDNWNNKVNAQVIWGYTE